MAKVIKFSDAPAVIPKGLERPFRHTLKYFGPLGAKILQQAMTTFRTNGGRGGHRKWLPFSRNTLFNKGGSFRKRRGTDDNRNRRYSSANLADGQRGNMFRASGLFRNSFTVQRITPKKVLVGTNHQLATEIMGTGGGRQVLFVLPSDKQLFNRMFVGFYKKFLKF
jgi:hypothetical protein